MPSIAFLIAKTDFVVDDNYQRFANEMREQNYAVYIGFIDSLAMQNSQVVADMFLLETPLTSGTPFPFMTTLPLEKLDTIWLLSLGLRNNFLDKFQLLYTLEGQCRIINSLTAIMHFKSKYLLASHPEVFQHPELFAATDPQALYRHMLEREQVDPGQRWIVKPPAGSLGRSVFLLSVKDPNAQVILETLTGVDADQYCLMQPYVKEIETGEKRVLIAGGEPVGQYLRLAAKDHRTNRMQGAALSACELTNTERAYCRKIGTFLVEQGIEFAGLDLAYPWVIEFNVINPGGLLTIEQLTGSNHCQRIIEQIFTPRAHRPADSINPLTNNPTDA
ncbi:MAG: hypothetical protein QNL99_15190 [SAR86 cluster bacterium]|uniref:ATP-grasp domain-containing protein n=1 Tax=SAR86 cluster bacterium TaxID=2030880 RepID=A0A972W016_9GAMM|nr:hypothetical protein [SAR86 cluster bacterium]